MSFKILITGGAGYIGSELTKLLLNNDHDVTVIDNFMYKQSSLLDLCRYKNLKVIKGDVRDMSILKKLVKDNDIIIPLAAKVGAPICNFDPIGSKSVNHDAILNLFKLLSNDQIVLMPTTNSAYGSGDKDNFCDENTKLNPISNYAKDKVIIEDDLCNLNNFISFRFATIFGLSQRMRLDLLVNDFVYRAVNDKFLVLFESSFKRNYLHVIDSANVFLHAINNFSNMRNNIYNVGLSDANISKKELCKIIQKKIKGFVYFEENIQKDPDQRNYIVSNKKIEKTGFSTSVSLSNGIDELIKGFNFLKKTEHTNF